MGDDLKIKIGDKTISRDSPCYFIAEGATNHNNRLDLGIRLLDEALNAGADSLKIQTYKAENLVTRDAPRFWEMADKDIQADGTQYDSYSKVDQLSIESYHKMNEHAKKIGIEFFSTPFDEEGVDFLDELGVKLFKIASCDLTNIPLLRYVAKTNKPIILSTGMANIGEIEEAVESIRDEGNEKIVLLHCTIKYPTPYDAVNLRAMTTMMDVFPELPIGLSDHSIGIEIPLAAVALGAKCIEKHYTFDKSAGLSSDHWLAVDTKELEKMVTSTRNIECALGSPVKRMDPIELPGKKFARRSIVSLRKIEEGETITKDMLALKRPGTGIAPKFFDLIVGCTATNDIEADKPLTWEMVLRKVE